MVRGSGPEEPGLRRLARDLGIEASVRILGRLPREAMVDLYNLADIVLCTSRTDLLPFSLMEAAACGRPCVAADVGAIRDIVVDGETGLVVREPNVERIGAAVASLLQDADASASLGHSARSRAMRHFALDVVAGRLLEVYRDVAG